MYFKTLALWQRDHFGRKVELPLTGSPCELVLHGQTAHYPTELCSAIPRRSFAGRVGRAELLRGAGVGRAGPDFRSRCNYRRQADAGQQRAIDVMRIFAERVRAEVQRLRMDGALREANTGEPERRTIPRSL